MLMHNVSEIFNENVNYMFSIRVDAKLSTSQMFYPKCIFNKRPLQASSNFPINSLNCYITLLGFQGASRTYEFFRIFLCNPHILYVNLIHSLKYSRSKTLGSIQDYKIIVCGKDSIPITYFTGVMNYHKKSRTDRFSSAVWTFNGYK